MPWARLPPLLYGGIIMTESTRGASPPVSRRYFYTDPLAAAWMARHFGMRYQALPSHITSYDFIEGSLDGGDGPYIIHPDSLHLLEPQIGDKSVHGLIWNGH